MILRHFKNGCSLFILNILTQYIYFCIFSRFFSRFPKCGGKKMSHQIYDVVEEIPWLMDDGGY